MKKIIGFIICIYFFTLTVPQAAAAKENTLVPHTNEVHLILDSQSYKQIPDHFRKSSDKINTNLYKNINTKGLQGLKISGSGQFSGFILPLLISAIDHPNIISVDLRQESHGFINGLPVSWFRPGNNINEGLSREEVIKVTIKRLNSIVLGVPISFYNHPEITVIPRVVMDEKQLTTKDKVGYEFIPVTDNRNPTVAMIDFFVSFVKDQPQNSWLHFHCKEGIGRTTTFMTMYDMMKNSSVATKDEIINRQIALARFSEDEIISFLKANRVKLFDIFYDYCKSQEPEFTKTFSDYLKEKNESIPK